MRCLKGFGATCRAEPCPGLSVEGACAHFAKVEATRIVPRAIAFDEGALHALHLARSCDHRGPIAFDSHPCNCRWVCNAGKGSPIRGTDRVGVSIRDCLECVSPDSTEPKEPERSARIHHE
jgi:hypothetical protein